MSDMNYFRVFFKPVYIQPQILNLQQVFMKYF